MSINPYEAPGNTDALSDPSFEVPEHITKVIKRAGWAGIVSGSMTLLIAISKIPGASRALGLEASALVNTALIFGLALRNLFSKKAGLALCS